MRLKTKDKIIKLGYRYGLSDKAMQLLVGILDAANHNGEIKGYKSLEPQFVSLYKGNIADYYAAYQDLLISKFIVYNKYDDNLFIRPYLSPYFYRILGTIEGRKRSYRKSIDTMRGEYDYLMKKYASRMDPELDPELETKEIRYNTKTNGVKIPESLHPYFTGEPLTAADVKALSRLDRDYLRLESQRRDLTKEEKRVYYACMKYADGNGVIDDYSEVSLIESILKDFGDGSVCRSTVYVAIKKLIELGLIRIDYNENAKRLLVVGYKEAFERKERFVIIPDVVLDQVFKKCQASAVKVFFKVMFMLNNGDGGEGSNSGPNKSIRLSFEKFLPGRAGKHKEACEDWLRKRYPGELCAIIWGDIEDPDINSLSYFFHITPDNKEGRLSYYFKVRSRFYISKRADLFKAYLALTGNNKKRADIIESEFRKHGFECSNDDLRALVKIFRGAGRRKIAAVIGRLIDRIKTGKENGWPEIRSIPAYIYTLYKQIDSDPIPGLV